MTSLKPTNLSRSFTNSLWVNLSYALARSLSLSAVTLVTQKTSSLKNSLQISLLGNLAWSIKTALRTRR